MTKKIDDGGPVHPEISCDEASLSTGGTYTDLSGISRRDLLAGLAMQSHIEGQYILMANAKNPESFELAQKAMLDGTIEQTAYIHADAMIAEGKKNEKA